jgi:dTDP-4-amino-4,6-dideoxygalactose transaminase
MSVPPANPAPPFLPFTRPTIAEVLRSGWITGGPMVKAFEAKLSDYFGGRPVRVFNSGTCTMEIALRLAGIGPGDEVITTPISWVATSNVILSVGARPVFVDVDPVTRNLDLECIESAITNRTKAILPVDLSGLPVDRDRLYAIAKKHRLRVVEDAAQSFGSTWGGRKIGAIGDLVSFSFQANKNITTAEGGCLVLNDEEEAKLAEKYRLQGVVRTGFDGMEVDLVGGKFNMTDVAARIGLGQLPHVDRITAERGELARAYFSALAHLAEKRIGLRLPLANFTDTNWHMFQVVLPEDNLSVTRGQIMAELHAAGIGTGVHYPPIHLFALYRSFGWKEGDFPQAEFVGRNILTLPLFASMTTDDVARVARTLTDILQAHLQS